MIHTGEIIRPVPGPTGDFFVEQATDGRTFYVPKQIAVSGLLGIYNLWPSNGACIERTASIDPSAIIGIGAIIESWCSVGPNVKIGRRTHVHDRVSIGQGTKIGNTVRIGRTTTIGENCRIEPSVSIGSRVHIDSDVTLGIKARIYGGETVSPGTVIERNGILGTPPGSYRARSVAIETRS